MMECNRKISSIFDITYDNCEIEWVHKKILYLLEKYKPVEAVSLSWYPKSDNGDEYERKIFDNQSFSEPYLDSYLKSELRQLEKDYFEGDVILHFKSGVKVFQLHFKSEILDDGV